MISRHAPILFDADEADAYAAGDRSHVRALMALGGHPTALVVSRDGVKVKVLIGPDRKPWRPGAPCGHQAQMRARAAPKPRPTRPAVKKPAAAPAASRPGPRSTAILALLALKPMSTTELMRALQAENDSIGRILRRLARGGLIRVLERGAGGGANINAITDAGRGLLSLSGRRWS